MQRHFDFLNLQESGNCQNIDQTEAQDKKILNCQFKCIIREILCLFTARKEALSVLPFHLILCYSYGKIICHNDLRNNSCNW